MSVYQILYMDKTTDSAVCNEAVKLASKRGFSGLKGFVNGVLRNIVRNKEAIAYPERDKELLKFLSVTYSMPEWIVSKWIKQFGEKETEDILKGLMENRPLIIRVDENLSLEEKEALLSEFTKEGLEYSSVDELAYAYTIKNPDRVDNLPGFLEGKIMIQDAGSMHIIEMAKVEKGDHVIDVCGAPGGKALHAATKLNHTGNVIVRDLSDRKVDLINENIDRSGYENVFAEVFDATVLNEKDIETADLVIADLPCSGLGVIGRKSDIKYRVTPEDVLSIASLQRQILDTVWQYVKPGKRLIYSTCTLTEEENTENAKWFEENHPFKKVDERTLFPGKDGTDGFYMACFVREA